VIISQTPLRMSFTGGGSDLPAFYRQFGGAVISTAIDKYVYVSINRKFDGGIRLAYSRTEEVGSLAEIDHELVKASFEMLGLEGGVEITTTADIPSRGTGLGSSSSFTVGLINVISAYQGQHITAAELGKHACEVEIDRCGAPIGKQDQYAAAFGGFNLIEFNPDDSVHVTPVVMSKGVREQLKRHIIVFYTGITRSAAEILKHQAKNSEHDLNKQATLRRMVALTYDLAPQLSAGNIDRIGEILHENWLLKKGLANGISNDLIDHWYQQAIGAGAIGGKLLGAGSGGFLMFLAPREHHEAIARAVGLRRIDFQFEPLGSRILFYHPR
jgi:D-glycero-alpha-D-manno-heptose-7-phosphate kinase